MNKFERMLAADNKTIKAARAKIIAEDMKDAQEELIRVFEKEEKELRRALIKLSDVSPDSEFSLKVVKDNFDANSWVAQIQDAKVRLANNSVQLKLAKETYEEWFKDIK